MNWQVVPSIRIRGTYGTSFRGPALYENYLAAQTSFTGATDPCQNYGVNGDPSSNLFKNCASEGLPGNFPGYSSTPEVFSQGALGRLKPETSKNITVGPVWTPSFIDLQVAFDYFHIEVDNEIAQLGPSNILSLCYGSNDFRVRLAVLLADWRARCEPQHQPDRRLLPQHRPPDHGRVRRQCPLSPQVRIR